jgi:hypothetical protein
MRALHDTLRQVMREHHLPAGDFPDPARFAEILGAFDLNVRQAVGSTHPGPLAACVSLLSKQLIFRPAKLQVQDSSDDACCQLLQLLLVRKGCLLCGYLLANLCAHQLLVVTFTHADLVPQAEQGHDQAD